MRLCQTFGAIVCFSVFLVGCATSQPVNVSNKWSDLVKNSAVLRQNHAGFALYDIEKQQTVAEYQSDRYFTPASNAKLFTFYAGLCILGDSVPALRYTTLGDSLVFWGTGDPNFLHPDMPSSNVLSLLKNWKGHLFYYPNNYTGKRFGAGWSWVDFADYYQCELSALPLYGNIVRFTNRTVSPRIFKDSLRTAGWSENFKLSRDEYNNSFYSMGWPSRLFTEDVPYRTSPQLTIHLLSDTLQKQVRLIGRLPNPTMYKTFKSITVDTMYRRMLQVSDNMLAEQIMLLCASQLDSANKGFDTQKSIEYMKKNYLADLPDEPIWEDGSGLSRYNLVTPRSMAVLLQKIYIKVNNQQRLFNMLAINGKAGTLKNLSRNNEPFIFAKTGSLSNNYSLSGYLKTKSNKILIFSIMNNNFNKKTSEIRAEVQRILTEIYEKYQ